MNPSASLNIVDLFSGIGGFSLGLHRADPRFKTIAFCEIEPFCQEVLKQNFPGVTLYNDIKDTKINEPTFLVVGGFPCQGFSQAGLQRGTEDDRYLWGEMFDVIKHTQPRWVIAENVRGIVTTQDGLAFNTVHTDLESEGYEVQAFNIPAIGKGAWHKRERIWFIANTDSNQYWSKIRGVEREKKEIQREYSEYLSSRPASNEELDPIKQQIILGLNGQFETFGSLLSGVSGIVSFDRGDDYLNAVPQKYNAVTIDQVNAAAQKYLDPETWTWFVVGDLSKIEEDIRNLGLGEVEIIVLD